MLINHPFKYEDSRKEYIDSCGFVLQMKGRAVFFSQSFYCKILMKTNSSINYISKTVLVSGIMVFSSSYLSAWTISVLDPTTTQSEYSSYNGSYYTTFKSYLNDAGFSLTSGTLSGYTMGSSDAVIVNFISTGHYSTEELSVLNSLLHSNTRVLVFGENYNWNASNQDLADLVGGINGDRTGVNAQTVSNVYPLLTEGVSKLEFAAPGILLPNGSNGISFTSDNAVSLWGTNENFLLVMDVNMLDNARINTIGADNQRMAQNIVSWLGGISQIPEPSSYAMIFALAAFATLSLQRRRKSN